MHSLGLPGRNTKTYEIVKEPLEAAPPVTLLPAWRDHHELTEFMDYSVAYRIVRDNAYSP
jgi:hypothetical protein